ncbi:MAG: maleylpyruvate isomerase N-terminal domain-containing protein [Dehalococcoidia bacterium]|nr:maleylpyruvate isomerase N-terminal domain-containing protein [Dehalococcoidia bacterium]
MTTDAQAEGGIQGPYEGVDHLVALQSARKQLLDILGDLDDDAAGQVVHDEWRVRDLLTHLASWDRLVLGFLEDFRSGQREFAETASPLNEWAAWNAEQVAAAPHSLAEVLRELDAARDALLNATYELDPAALPVDVLAPWGFADTVLGHLLAQAVHDAQHADQIRRALGPR